MNETKLKKKTTLPPRFPPPPFCTLFRCNDSALRVPSFAKSSLFFQTKKSGEEGEEVLSFFFLVPAFPFFFPPLPM